MIAYTGAQQVALIAVTLAAIATLTLIALGKGWL